MATEATQPAKIEEYDVPDIITDTWNPTALDKLKPLISGGVNVVTHLLTCTGQAGPPGPNAKVKVTCPVKGTKVKRGDDLDIGVSDLY